MKAGDEYEAFKRLFLDLQKEIRAIKAQGDRPQSPARREGVANQFDEIKKLLMVLRNDAKNELLLERVLVEITTLTVATLVASGGFDVSSAIAKASEIRQAIAAKPRKKK